MPSAGERSNVHCPLPLLPEYFFCCLVHPFSWFVLLFPRDPIGTHSHSNPFFHSQLFWPFFACVPFANPYEFKYLLFLPINLLLLPSDHFLSVSLPIPITSFPSVDCSSRLPSSPLRPFPSSFSSSCFCSFCLLSSKAGFLHRIMLACPVVKEFLNWRANKLKKGDGRR